MCEKCVKEEIVFKECYECEEPILEGEEYETLQIYHSPFDTVAKEVYVHTHKTDDYGTCFEKLYDTSWADFRLFDCSECNRIIHRQNLHNGWHTHYRALGDEHDYKLVCLDCYEKDLLENGASRESFEAGSLTGMFAPKAEEAGFEKVSGFAYYFVSNKTHMKKYCEKAIELIDAGYKVLTDLERMAIGGMEGYVTMWAKKGEE